MAKKQITRREFVKVVGSGALVAGAATFGVPTLLRAANKPIKFGQLNTTSGIMASQGVPAMRAAQIAQDIINQAGGIMGRKLELVQEDDQVKPSVGVRKFRKLVLEDKVDFVFGTNSSGVGLACVPLANEFKKIFISTSMSDKYTGANCSPYVFRIGESTCMASKASAYCMVANAPTVKKWAGINPDYVFGRESWDFFKQGMKDKNHPVEYVKESFSPFGCQDYKPYITALLESKADGVFTSLWTGDLINFVKQAKPFGFFDKVKAFVNNTTAVATSIGLGNEMVPFWGEARYYPFYRDSELNRQYISMYQKKFGGYPAADTGAECFASVVALKLAIEKAGTTDTPKVIAALEGLEFEVPEGKKWIRPEDHSGIDEVVLLGKFHHDPKYPFWVYDPKTYFTVPGKEIAMPLSQTGCKMAKP
ncbi:MAG: ABC transporter substrate-binding protein [Proteobacteria bacterium]|nr:ABC transporter substrate-binding protein [Pseudomonadota bacterium]MBU4275238.1 ABC transporter substrate-binding protein [Pseudomonadota bacterium]MBU4382515.1 ABC transporter substrate-binding protein [Pseudomonadota bacterium]MCG2765032.1 ABC transporter substrate-binding protein [Desulfarculaceae bacterium]